MDKEQIISDLNKVYVGICELEIKGEQNILIRYNIMSLLQMTITNLKNKDIRNQGDCNVDTI